MAIDDIRFKLNKLVSARTFYHDAAIAARKKLDSANQNIARLNEEIADVSEQYQSILVSKLSGSESEASGDMSFVRSGIARVSGAK